MKKMLLLLLVSFCLAQSKAQTIQLNPVTGESQFGSGNISFNGANYFKSNIDINLLQTAQDGNGWMKFDLSSLPSCASITDVKLVCNEISSASNYPLLIGGYNTNLGNINNDPAKISTSNIAAFNTLCNANVGPWKTQTLVMGANDIILLDNQTGSSDPVRITFNDIMSSTSKILILTFAHQTDNLILSGYNNSNVGTRPYLEITYTISCSVPVIDNFLITSPLVGSNQHYDVCSSSQNLIACSFTYKDLAVGNTIEIDIPQGGCFLDHSFSPVTPDNTSNHLGRYNISISGSGVYYFYVDLTAISCDFVKPQPLQAHIDVLYNGMPVPKMPTEPININLPFVTFTPGQTIPRATEIVKGSELERTYTLQASQPADYNSFSLKIKPENEIYITNIKMLFFDQNGDRIDSQDYRPDPITCDVLPDYYNLINPSNQTRPLQCAEPNFRIYNCIPQFGENGLVLFFTQTPSSLTDIQLPSGFGKDWSILVTETFNVITTSSRNVGEDPPSTYSVYSDLCMNSSLCSDLSLHCTFESGDKMNINCTDHSATNTFDAGLSDHGTLVSNTSRIDAYVPENTNFYYRIIFPFYMRVYGIKMVINSTYFNLPNHSLTTDDIDVGSEDANGIFHALIHQPEISSTDGHTMYMCFTQDTGIGMNGPLTNLFRDPSKIYGQCLCDMPDQSELIIHFKNVIFKNNAPHLRDGKYQSDVLGFIESIGIHEWSNQTVDLCMERTPDCDSEFTYLSGNPYLGAVTGSIYNVKPSTEKSFEGDIIATSQNTDIYLEAGSDPGHPQNTSATLSYSFKQTNGTTPWDLAGPLLAGQGIINKAGFLNPYGETFYAHVEIPKGFKIDSASFTSPDGVKTPVDTPPHSISGDCNLYDFVLPTNTAGGTFAYTIKISNCSSSSCPKAPVIVTSLGDDGVTVQSSQVFFYLEFRSQLNKSSADSGVIDQSLYHIVYAADSSLSLVAHCTGGCGGATIISTDNNFTFDRNSFGWRSIVDYYENASRLTIDSPGVDLKSVYINDDILATCTGYMNVPSGSCYKYLNLEINNQRKLAANPIFTFKSGTLTVERKPSNQAYTITLNNNSAIYPSNLPVPPLPLDTSDYVVVVANLDKVYPNIYNNDSTLYELIQVDDSDIISFVGHYELNCENTNSILPGYYKCPQLRAEFTLDDSTHYGANPGGCYANSCDTRGSSMTALIVETDVSASLSSTSNSQYSDCGLIGNFTVTSKGGYAFEQDDFYHDGFREYRPSIVYPDNFGITISNNLYLAKATSTWYNSRGDKSELPFYRLTCRDNSTVNPTCPSFTLPGSPLGTDNGNTHVTIPFAFINNTDHTGTIATNGLPRLDYVIPRPPSYSDATLKPYYWRTSQKHETRDFAFNLVKNCYLEQGTFSIDSFDLALLVPNSRVNYKTVLNNNSISTGTSCETSFNEKYLSSPAITYNSSPTSPPYQPEYITLLDSPYFSDGNVYTFRALINSEEPYKWIYCKSPNNNVTILRVKDCETCVPSISMENHNGLFYFPCESSAKIIEITVQFGCEGGDGQKYNPTFFSIYCGTLCNMCKLLNDLDNLISPETISQLSCNQVSKADGAITPNAAALDPPAPVNIDVEYCTDANIPIHYRLSSGQLKNAKLIISGFDPAGSLSITGLTGHQSGSNYIFDLGDILTFGHVNLILKYTPICATYGSKQKLTYQIIGDDACTNGYTFPPHSDTISFISHPTVTVSADDQSFCQGDHGILTASSGVTYSWDTNPIQTTQSITVSTAGTYTVSETLVNGCSCLEKASIEITVNPLPFPTIIGSQNVCENQTKTYTTESGQNDYVWNVTGGSITSGVGSNSITVLWGSSGPGHVTVNYKDAVNLCSASSPSDLTITINAYPIVPTITANRNTTLCQGESVTLTSSSAANNTWSNLSTGQSITVASAGSYSVIVSNLGCSATSAPTEVIVNPNPVPSIIGASFILCEGASTTLSAESIYSTYSWSGIAITGSTSGQSINTSPINTTTYYLTVTNGNGCGGSTNATIVVDPAMILTSSVTPVSSYGGNNGAIAVAVSGGSPGYTYSIDGGIFQTSNIFSGLMAGTYTITVKDLIGCTVSKSYLVPQPIGSCTGYVSYTQGGYSLKNGGTPGQYIATNFNTYFSAGLTIGCTAGFTMGFTNVLAVRTFLKNHGQSTSVSLTQTSADNLATPHCEFEKQIVTLTLNIQFDLLDPNFAPGTSGHLADLYVSTGIFSGMTVQQVLNEANNALGGCGSAFSLSDLNVIVTAINESYDPPPGCNGTCGTLTCSFPSSTTLRVASNLTSGTCSNGNVFFISTNVEGGIPPYHYNWSTGDTTNGISNLMPGTFTLMVHDQIGTATSVSATLLADTTGSDTASYSSSIVNNNVAFTDLSNSESAGATKSWLWNFDDASSGGNNISTLQNPTHNFTIAGPHHVCLNITYTKGTSSCSSSHCEDICIPYQVSISASGSTTFCQGSNVVLSSNISSGVTYQWQNNGTEIVGAISSTYSATSSGNFTCVVSYTCGSATSNSITIAVNSLPLATISASPSTVICLGSSVTLSANTGAGLSYQWQLNSGNIPGATSSSYVVTVAGNYTCVVSNGNCSATSNSLSLSTSGTATLIFQPNASAGVDAEICSYPAYINNNYGTTPDFDSWGWTISSVQFVNRSLIRFDLSSIPANAIVQQATLSLYNNPNSGIGAGSHSNLTGSDASWLQKIIGTWNENSVTWSNQPSVDPSGQVAVPQSTSSHQDYTIDVTNLVQGMITNPSTNYGFMLRLQTESHYMALIFASSDNANAAKWPKISVTYTTLSASITAGGPTTFCSGGSVTLNANTGTAFSYQWKLNGGNVSGATASSYVATTSGNYTCVVSDPCVSTTSNSITVVTSPPDPGNPTSNSPQCSGANITLTRNGTPPLGETWYWQTNAGGISTTNSGSTYVITSSGTYYIRSRNNTTLCWSSGAGSVSATINPLPNSPGSPSSDSPQCQSTGVTLTRNGTSPSGETWYWETSAGGMSTVNSGSTYSVNSSGTYYIRARNNSTLCWSNGEGNVTATINPLPASPGNPTINSQQCGDLSVTLTRTGTPPSAETWYWQISSNGTDTTNSGSTFTVNSSGIYSIRSRNNLTLCWSSGAGNIMVTINPIPAVPGNPTSNSPQCASPGVTLIRNGTPPAGVTWYWENSVGGTSTSNSGTTFTVTSTGTYYIKARDNSTLCWSNGAGSLTVTVNPLPPVSISPSFLVICEGASSSLTVSGASSYLWNTGETTSVINSSGGSYSVQGQGTNGCYNSAYANVVVESINLSASITPVSISGSSDGAINLNVTGGSAPYSYSWYPGGETTQNISNLSVGNYSVSATDANGCSSQQSWDVNLQEFPCDGTSAFNFSQDGCQFNFYDMSNAGSNTITNWYWSFGDGTYSLRKNPVHTFHTPGTYHVCLIITLSDGTSQCTSSYCEDITPDCQQTSCGIIANFKARTENCTVAFDDYSATASNTTITGWLWDFGDNSTSTMQDPIHNYSVPGSHDVCLTVFGFDGSQYCSDARCMSVNTSACGDTCDLKVDAIYNLNNCKAQFVDRTEAFNSSAITGWYWDFGDGTSSTAQNPLHIYSQQGNYNTCLTVFAQSTAGNCNQTLCLPINITTCESNECDVLPVFNYAVNHCKVHFIDFSSTGASTSIVGWLWDFGDNTQSFQENPIHTYSSFGYYHVCLTLFGATTEGECNSSYCIDVYIDEICEPADCDATANFNYTISNCNLHLIDNSGPGSAATLTGWNWDIGGLTMLQGDIVNYTFNNNLLVDICLTVTGINRSGSTCENTVCKTILVDDCNVARVKMPSLKETESQNISYSIVPNPSDGNFELQIESPENTLLKAELGNFYGQIIEARTLEVAKGMNRFKYQVKNKSKGVYLIRVQNDTEYHLLKVIIQ